MSEHPVDQLERLADALDGLAWLTSEAKEFSPSGLAALQMLILDELREAISRIDRSATIRAA